MRYSNLPSSDSETDSDEVRRSQTSDDKKINLKIKIGLCCLTCTCVLLLIGFVLGNVWLNIYLSSNYLSHNHTKTQCEQFVGRVRDIQNNATNIYHVYFDVYDITGISLLAKNMTDIVGSSYVTSVNLFQHWWDNSTITIFSRCRLFDKPDGYSLEQKYEQVTPNAKVTILLVILFGWLFVLTYCLISAGLFMLPMGILKLIERMRKPRELGYYSSTDNQTIN